MAASEQPDVACVVTGGASLGAIQVGMLRALYERGIAPDVIVGTSAGAPNGAFIASRLQTVATADALVYEGTSQIQRLVIAHETLLPRHVEPLAGVAA